MKTASCRGFTLIEMAMALLIAALLLDGLLPALSGRMEQRRIDAAQIQLDEIREAAIGYALASGRLPCPASPDSNGMESFTAGGGATSGECANPYDGYVPAATLGLVTPDGYARDPWGNRLHYAVTASNGNAYTRTNGIAETGIAALAPNLLVCATATGSSPTTCSAGTALTTGTPLVIYSTGSNGNRGGTSPDEAANPNPHSTDRDRVFVSHAPAAAASPGGEFDDLVIWLSPAILYLRMAEAGRLP